MNTPEAPEHDPLERLMQLAGRREPVQSKRATEIEKSTRLHWQQTLERRHKTRRWQRLTQLGIGIVATTTLALLITDFPNSSLQPETSGMVTKLIGAPRYGPPGDALSVLAVGTDLPVGSVLVTGIGEGVALRLGSGHNVRIDESSRLRTEPRAVVLDEGAVYVDSDSAGTDIEVRTPLGTVQELGTQYMARLSHDRLEVSVREGIVRLDYGAGAASAKSGEVISLDDHGRTQSMQVSRYGRHWAWTARLAQSPALNGTTLAEFLAWLTREEGWQLSYASQELARAAESVELSGDIGDLGGEESLAAVMTITGWQYTLIDGELIISAGQ